MSTQPNAISEEPNAGAISEVVETEVVESQPTAEKPVEQEITPSPDGAETGAQPDQQTIESKTDDRKLPAYVKALKESDPEAFKKAKAQFYELDGRRSIHPTVQAAREEHELIAAHGGREGIAKLREDGQFFKTAAQQFVKGDPAFVKDLFDEDPIAAALHVPIMLDAFREKDKAGYQATLAKLWDTEFQAAGLVERGLKPLRAAIQTGNKEEAEAILDSILNWKESISSVARTAEDPRVKTLLAERAKQHETREQTERDEFLKSYRTDALNAAVEDASKVFDSYFRGRKMDAEDRNDLLREAAGLANRAVAADKEFVGQREAHLANGDAQAALTLTRARFNREWPNAIKRIARRYGMFAGPAKPAPANGAPPANGGQPPAQGFVKVNARPNPEDIDRSKTTNEMILNDGQAILKNGRKVSWKHLRTAAA